MAASSTCNSPESRIPRPPPALHLYSESSSPLPTGTPAPSARYMQKLRPSLSSRHRPTALLTRTHPSSSQATSNPYPYPTTKNPTPHQIFHLSPSATETDIKARYFDLVRIYHPDKATSSVHPDTAHERFQAITTAYDILRGKKKSSDLSSHANPQDLSYQTTAAYRAARRRRQELYSSGAVDDRWKDRIFIGLGLATVGVFVLQSHLTRKEAMSDMMLSRRSTYPSPADANKKPSKEEERLSA